MGNTNVKCFRDSGRRHQLRRVARELNENEATLIDPTSLRCRHGTSGEVGRVNRYDGEGTLETVQIFGGERKRSCSFIVQVLIFIRYAIVGNHTTLVMTAR